MQTSDQIRATVRDAYAVATQKQQSGCCGGGASWRAPTGSPSRQLGYTEADLAAVPDGADLGLGCGNPQAIAGLRPGERVLDLGSGAGSMPSSPLGSGAEQFVASALIEAVKPA